VKVTLCVCAAADEYYGFNATYSRQRNHSLSTDRSPLPSIIHLSTLPGPPNSHTSHSSTFSGASSFPPTRTGHSLVSCPSDSSPVYMFGGMSRDVELLNGLWRLNLTSGRWDLIDSEATDRPAPRYHRNAE